MTPQLAAALDGLERRRVSLLERLQRHPDALIRRRPAPGSWSLVEVAEHIVLAENATLGAIVRPAPGTRHARTWYDRILNALIARTLESSVRIPVTGRILTPSGTQSLPEIATRWAEVRASWRAYLSAANEREADLPVFRHPLGAVMTRLETLVFLQRHFDHHLFQIRRIERALEIGDGSPVIAH